MSAGDLALNCSSTEGLTDLLKLLTVNASDCSPYIDCDNKDVSPEALIKQMIVEDENGNLALNICMGTIEYTETDPIVGAVNGIVQSDGAGNISAATAGVDYVDTESDPVVGAINGIVKANGAGTISVASDGTDYISSVVVDTTPQLGGDLDLNEKNIKLKEAPASNSTTSGNIITLTAGAALAFGDVCYMGSDGKMEKGDADAVANSFCWAMALGTIAENNTGLFALPGTIVRYDTWNWGTVGQPVYLDTATAGGMTQSPPSGSGDIVQIIGVATHGDRILFYPQLVQVEIV